MGKPKKYLRDSFGYQGPHYRDGCCLRCGKKLNRVVHLELNMVDGEYYLPGSVRPDESQGVFEFGPDCADALYRRVNAA